MKLMLKQTTVISVSGKRAFLSEVSFVIERVGLNWIRWYLGLGFHVSNNMSFRQLELLIMFPLMLIIDQYIMLYVRVQVQMLMIIGRESERGAKKKRLALPSAQRKHEIIIVINKLSIPNWTWSHTNCLSGFYASFTIACLEWSLLLSTWNNKLHI